MAAMFYVICPLCHAHVEIPAEAVGADRNDLFNVAQCDYCDLLFDFDDEEVEFTTDPQP
jgi:hypothetical protein